MQTITKSDIVFHSSSGGDWNGRLFEWNGEIHRAIGSCYVNTLEKLFAEQVIQGLIDKGLLVQTELASLQLEDYPMVVKHHRIPFVSYAGEWSASALKDVALLIIDLEIELAQIGFSIHDVNPWNVLFEGTKPVFVDLGAIMPLENTRIWSSPRAYPYFPAYEQFCQLILYPLYLISWGYGRIARSLLLDYRGVSKIELLKLSPRLSHQLQAFPRQPTFKRQLKATKQTVVDTLKSVIPVSIRSQIKQQLASPQSTTSSTRVDVPSCDLSSRLKFLRSCRQEIEAINTDLTSEWAGYYKAFHVDDVPSFEVNDSWTIKNLNVLKILTELRPDSVLDIGSNTGWYSQLAAKKGSNVISFDTDDACVDQLYRQAKRNYLPILPLLMDFRSPSPGYGPCNRWLLPATERLACDLVLVLAVVHHLVSKQYLNFEQIAQTLSLFSKKWVLVEFMPPDDEWVRDWLTPEFSWYTLENFMSSLHRHFSQIEILESYPSPRKLLLCTK
jgi:SAM-dependent methyltransferase